jgi:hypothetical protein
MVIGLIPSRLNVLDVELKLIVKLVGIMIKERKRGNVILAVISGSGNSYLRKCDFVDIYKVSVTRKGK